MRRWTGILVAIMLFGVGISSLAQSDLDQFPLGTTKMVYHVTAEDMSEPQILELVVTAHADGRYTVRMLTEQTGNEDELATGFGFMFGAATVSSGGGHDVSYTSLQALMDQRGRIQEGQEYALSATVDFTSVVTVEIASVWCFEGTIVDQNEPDTRMTVAIALTSPVYISPRIRAEELRNGEWIEVFVLELIEYSVTEGSG